LIVEDSWLNQLDDVMRVHLAERVAVAQSRQR
jgi:hypothetical protein